MDPRVGRDMASGAVLVLQEVGAAERRKDTPRPESLEHLGAQDGIRERKKICCQKGVDLSQLGWAIERRCRSKLGLRVESADKGEQAVTVRLRLSLRCRAVVVVPTQLLNTTEDYDRQVVLISAQHSPVGHIHRGFA